jgi:hypothetical protein
MELRYATFSFLGYESYNVAQEEGRKLGLEILRAIARPIGISQIRINYEFPQTIPIENGNKLCTNDTLNYTHLMISSTVGDFYFNIEVDGNELESSPSEVNYRGLVEISGEQKTLE